MKRVVIANFYPIWPPLGGGQRRIFFLARELAKDFDVEIVVPERGGISQLTEFSSSFRQCCVAVEDQFRKSESDINQDVKMASDLAYATYWHQCIEYQSVLARRVANADVVISAHPYSIKAIRSALAGRDIPVIFDSQNVEFRQKFSILKDFPKYLETIRDIEKLALETSAMTIACSELDARGFEDEYGFNVDQVVIIENGVDTLGVQTISNDIIAQIRSRLNISDQVVSLFGGSMHAPNLLAVERILEFARDVPHMMFLILGSVCDHPPLKAARAFGNVRCLGGVTESVKWIAFQIADIALNPMELGSGTNIKMFEYAAAGRATVSTAFGARGIPLVDGTDYLAAEIDAFPTVLGRLSHEDRPKLAEIGRHARDKVAAVADWSVIGKRYRNAVRALCT